MFMSPIILSETQPRPWCRWESGSEGASHRLCESVPPFHTTAVQSGCLRLCASVLFPGYCPPRKQQIRPLRGASPQRLSLIHISEPTRRTPISYAVFCLKKNKKKG